MVWNFVHQKNDNMKKLLFVSAIIACIGIGCKKTDTMPMDTTVEGPDKIVFAINANNELLQFNARVPGTITQRTSVLGITAGEKLISIDFRPATGELYALSNASKLYVINQVDGTSRQIGPGAFTPLLSGSIASIDFNPTVDRIRLVTNSGQNLRLNPETGSVVAVDTDINSGIPASITGIAYLNNKAGASTTTLFNIDQTNKKLYKQDPPNNGTLVEIGNLGINFSGNAAFDILPGNTALLAADTTLYVIDVSNGKASKIGKLGEVLIDIAVPTDPVAYATDVNNNLLIFNPTAVGDGIVTKSLTGLQPGESILGIDFRPVNGQLYALGSSSRMYTINLSSGVATQVGAGVFSTLLSGTDFGFDFNPLVDRIRVVSNTGQNLRVNPNDGLVVAVDGNLNPASPMASSAAYTNNFAGTTSTVLLVIDHGTDKLYTQNPPNNGTLVEVGSLGIDLNSSNGFDIGSRSNTGYLVATAGSSTGLYTVNLASGQASAPIAFPLTVRGFSIGLGF